MSNTFKSLFAILFAVLTLAVSASDSLDEIITQEMQASKAPGMAYAVVKDGELTKMGAEGVLDNRQDVKAGTDSSFIIGSVSKSFTAMAIMQLVESGAVELDQTVSHYLKNFSQSPAADVTIRQLLSHTSGYSTLQGNQSQTDYTTDAEALKRRVDALAATKPFAKPNTKWSYSNANYQILGRVIEVASDMDYASYIEQNILKPVGMTNSFVFAGKNKKNMATGHRPWFGSKKALTDNKTGLGSAPQGGIAASASDMARYMTMLMNGQDDVINAESKRLLMSPASKASPNYGLGWFVNTEKAVVFHSGSNPGYEALLTMKPESKKGAVVLVNAGSGYGFGETRQLRYGLTAAALDLPYGGEAGVGGKKITFITLLLLPLLFLFGIIRSWRKNMAISASTPSRLKLYVPLILAIALAWILLRIVPGLFGATYGAAAVFQPDMGILLALSSLLAILWAVIRVWLNYKPG